jgi:nucleotide-binding universal stress UspA family protein
MTQAGVTSEVRIDSGILVGHDGSDDASVALQWAARTAERLGVPLHVMRAWSITTAPTPPTMTGGYVPPLEDFEAAVLAALEQDLAGLGAPEGVEMHLHVVRGPATATLLHTAAHAEMLVVGRRGGGGFRGLLFGSTADQVVRHAPCPVVVVPSGPA